MIDSKTLGDMERAHADYDLFIPFNQKHARAFNNHDTIRLIARDAAAVKAAMQAAGATCLHAFCEYHTAKQELARAIR